jgi:hypothetical protein
MRMIGWPGPAVVRPHCTGSGAPSADCGAGERETGRREQRAGADPAGRNYGMERTGGGIPETVTDIVAEAPGRSMSLKRYFSMWFNPPGRRPRYVAEPG